MHIFVYNDYGSSELSVKKLFSCLRFLSGGKETRKHYKIEYINGEEVQNGKLDIIAAAPRRILLCMGGGFDLGFLQSLGGQVGCARIRDFVSRGGNYLGICAGAYLAARCIEFDLNGPLQVAGPRFLNFFPGKAIGPVNVNFKYNNDKTALAAKVRVASSGERQQQTFHFYLNGGCYFSPPPPNEQERNEDQVIAYFENETKANCIGNEEIAIVRSRFGQGTCLLSGVHFEFDPVELCLEESASETLNKEFTEHGFEFLERLLEESFDF